MRAVKLAGGFVAGLLLAVLLLAAAATLHGAPLLRWALEQRASRALGRPVSIDGAIAVAWGEPTRIVLHDVHLANVSDGSRPDMLVARRLAFVLPPRALLRGEPPLQQLSIDHALLVLETGPEGVPNWQLAATRQDEARVLAGLDRLDLSDTTLLLRDGMTGAERRLALDTLSAKRAADGLVTLAAAGRFASLPLRIAGSFEAASDPATPSRVDLKGALGNGRVSLAGTVSDPMRLAGSDLQLRLAGRDLGAIGDALGLKMPELRHFTASARLTGGESHWSMRDIALRLGESDLAGTLDVDARGAVPSVRAVLEAKQIDAADFAGFFAPSMLGPATPQQAEDAGRVIPAMPVVVPGLRDLPAELTLQLDAQRFVLPIGPPLEGLSAGLQLRRSQATFDPVSFRLAGGEVAAALTLDGRGLPQLAFDLDLRRIDLARLAAGPGMPAAFHGSSGITGGTLRLNGSGVWLRDMLASLRGEAVLFAGDGPSGAALGALAGHEVLQAAGLSPANGAAPRANCVALRFALDRGVAKATTLLLDTAQSGLTGTGEVNLSAETLYFDLRPKPKRSDRIDQAALLSVRGSFAKPKLELGESTPEDADASPPPPELSPLADAALGPDTGCSHTLGGASSPAPLIGSGHPPARH
ncbi:MAG TPA: AsmA family protein [Stellaceae bacterium]|nr:AsmA family protein [Stellaceae bacterium]